jgi:hypothetical protein
MNGYLTEIKVRFRLLRVIVVSHQADRFEWDACVVRYRSHLRAQLAVGAQLRHPRCVDHLAGTGSGGGVGRRRGVRARRGYGQRRDRARRRVVHGRRRYNRGERKRVRPRKHVRGVSGMRGIFGRSSAEVKAAHYRGARRSRRRNPQPRS